MTLAVFAGFLFDWLAVALSWKKIKPIAKITAMTLVILWTLTHARWTVNELILLLLLAQLSGLVGDILLLLSHRWFLYGLSAFLVGHLFYIVLIMINLASSTGINFSSPSTRLSIAGSAVLWGVALWIAYSIFTRDHFIKGRNGKLFWVLVQFYIWVLSGLMFLTFLRFFIQPGPNQELWLLPMGGVLFLISDVLLAYDRFVSKVNKGQLWVHMSYHLAQICLAGGFLLLFQQH